MTFDGPVSPVRFKGKTCRIAAIFNDSCSNSARFLCNPDCVAEGERFEPPVPFQVQRFSSSTVGSEAFGEFCTLLLFSTGYKSVDLIRSAWKRSVLIVQPLQFHYGLDDRANFNQSPATSSDNPPSRRWSGRMPTWKAITRCKWRQRSPITL